MYNFGPLAAQDDVNLLNYFHTTKQVKGLLNKEEPTSNCIFVIRPGGGKTALVKWLESESFDRPLVSIRPSHTQLVAPDDDFNLEDNRILIKVELYTSVISELLQRGCLSGAIESKCQYYMKNEWGEGIKEFFRDKLEGLSILGCGFTLKASDRRNYLGVIKRTKKLDKVSDVLLELSTKALPVVISDDPEDMVTKGLNELSRDNAIRIGAYLSVLTHLHSLGCQVLLFVKEHVLQGVQEHYPDSSHFEDRIEGIEWTASDLAEMINLRISKRLKKKWDEVFSIDSTKFEKKVFPYLINGPRDLLFICNKAGESGGKITSPAPKNTRGTLRDNKWNEIQKQFGRQWPRVGEFAQAIIGTIRGRHKNRSVSRELFMSTVRSDFESPSTKLHELRKKVNWIDTSLWATPPVDERLFMLGCLGYIHEKQKVYPWAGRSLEQFRASGSIFISPLFSG